MAGHRDHPVAHFPAGDALADALDNAGDLAARREGARRLELVLVLDDQEVGIVDRAGLHRDDHLPLARRRIGDLLQD